MQRLRERITELSLGSTALSILDAQIRQSKFLRHSWFNRWVVDAARECPSGFIAWLVVFFLNRKHWDTSYTIHRVIRSGEHFRGFINEQIVSNILNANSQYFDTVEKNPLTKRQREACASDEDATLVIAGAGTGKTSTILAKIGLLINTGQCKPSEILAISFTNKSAGELADRVKKSLDVEVEVSTFHKLGLRILAKAEGGKPLLAPFAANPSRKAKFIDSIIASLQDDVRFRSGFVDFYAYHRIEPKQMWHFNTLAEYRVWLSNNNIVSLDGEPKKSYQECVIANWLILNGVQFEYERPYEHETKTVEYRQYCPDFFIPGCNIYIEHFGVDEEGNTAPFVNRETYHQGMEWKRELHKRHQTILLETFSWEHSQGILLSALEKKLRQYGCVFTPLAPEIVIDMMNKSGLTSNFSELVSSFMTLYKGNGNRFNESHATELPRRGDRERHFLELFNPILAEYEKRNLACGQIDFEDMIVRATRVADAKEFESPYKYILIDEFQDISPGRAELVKAIRSQDPTCALFAVGDDWQSIYRFAGSDIGAMTKFSETFGTAREVALDTTFRFDNMSAAVSSAFILKNKVQIPKALNTISQSTLPSLILYRRPEGEPRLKWPLDEIDLHASGGESVLVLERYNFDLPQESEWVGLCSEYPRLKMEKMSIHKAKGLEADYVVMGLRGGAWGFPSQVVDDPLFDMVLTQADAYPHGEERRLFYVGMTRARYKTYLVCEIGQELSDFAAELISDKKYDVEICGIDTEKLSCRRCGTGTMLLRDGEGGKFYGCSNYPLCRNTEPTCPECRKGFLVLESDKSYSCDMCGYKATTCPKCKSGFLQIRKSVHGIFYGCSNFKDPNINCRYTENIRVE